MADKETPFEWRPVANSPQEHFLARTEFEGLFGGAAGGTKTETLLFLPLVDLLSVPKTSAVFFRREYSMLEDVVARSREFFPALGGEFNEGKARWTFQNGSRYYLHHMQHEKHKYNYQGREFEIICFDELTQFTESQYLYLFSRCRGNREVRWRIRSASNPGGIGHLWCKNRFIDKLRPYYTKWFCRVNDQDLEVPRGTANARSRFFVPSKVYDNPFYRDTEYVSNLMALPTEERRALLEGDWDVFVGQYFGMWRDAIHVVEPIKLDPNWYYFGAMDYGYRAPLCYLIGAMDFDGTLWIIREHYAAEMSIEKHSRAIKELESGLRIQARLADPSIWTRTPRETETGTDDSIAMMFSRHGVDFIKAENDVYAGCVALREWLNWEDPKLYDGTPQSVKQWSRIRIFQNCLNLRRTLPALVYANSSEGYASMAMKKRAEVYDTRGEDHPADTLRYLMMHVYQPTPQTPEMTGWRKKHLRPTSRGVVKFS